MNGGGRDGASGHVYLVSAVRTPIGKFGGAFVSTPAVDLGGVAIRAAVERAGLPGNARIDEVLMGQVIQAGAGQAPARQAALKGGLAVTTSATTINRVCGSGLKSIMLAAAEIRAGDAELVVAGGMENMNMAPFLLDRARFGYRLGDATMRDATVLDGLWCSINDCHMGTHAERVAIKEHVSRADQDAFALASHRNAVAAMDAGRFAAELAPVTVRDAKGRETVVAEDESPRRDTSPEALAKLRPAFQVPQRLDPDTDLLADALVTASVTAGNAPGITDGAAATIVASARAVERYGLKPLARIVGYAQAEIEPRWLFLAPVEGVRQLLQKIELPIEAFDLVEINEAFAAQALAVSIKMTQDGHGWDWEKTNVNGGAIALGHPVGQSGARIVITLLHEMKRRSSRYGAATLCVGGGQGGAMVVERI